jgi:long-subunit acyl-CoA synthetase (AMP-forming)/N-acetylglutamate synthase-like GNAT family acetyltransferase
MTDFVPHTAVTGPPVQPELLARVREALETLTHAGESTSADSGRFAACAQLVQATREAMGVLREAKNDPQFPPGRLHASRVLVHRILDGAAKKPVRVALHASPFQIEWNELLFDAVTLSDYTVGPLFFGRARELGDRTLFLLPPDDERGRISWLEAEREILEIGRALVAFRSQHGDEARVATLSANSLALALFDLACLVTGTVNIPIPANSTPPQIAAIWKDAGARLLFVGDALLADAARGVLASGDETPSLFWIDPAKESAGGVRELSEFLSQGTSVSDDKVRDAAYARRSSDLATIMYTSGSTGNPKGVPFTHRNLVTKRFARAAAWPDLGEGDVFLCYLPLFHTFGRWLELLGCVFWGAVYAFVEDSTIESLLYAFHRVRPTTFISVPKRWIQVAEAAGPLTTDEPQDERAISRSIREITGGRLRRGLSAAGYLPPAVFRRFHRAGIELHSGFGMTEATGGITMTPAGEYRSDSIGVALPGIELKIADDGELWIRGPYVTDPGSAEDPRPDGWLMTGDIVRVDEDEHLTIIDRKKEIFKNVQGETISPRRIEQLFSEFDSVARVFVIGDRRDFCTALIVPSKEIRERFPAGDSMTIESPELRDLYTPILATVNRFLAPYERLLDFAILARDLDESELTAKGTAKRSHIAEKYRDAIEPMYAREQIAVETGDVVVRLPQWFFRQIGAASSDLQAVPEGIALAGGKRRLSISRAGAQKVRVGELIYDPGGRELLLGEIMGRPEMWLANPSVVEFAGPGIEHWWRRGRRFRVRTRLAPGTQLISPDRIPESTRHASEIMRLHAPACRLHHPDREERAGAVEVIRAELGRPRSELEATARELLREAITDPEIRAEALRAIIPVLDPESLLDLLQMHFADETFLEERERSIVAEQILRADQLEAIAVRLSRGEIAAQGRDRLLRLLVRQAAQHAENHRRVRGLLVELSENAASASERNAMDALIGELVGEFRKQLPACAPAEGLDWNDVLIFQPGIASDHIARVRSAVAGTAVLSEAQALLAAGTGAIGGTLGKGAVRIAPVARGEGRTILRVEVRLETTARTPSVFEFALKLRDEQTWEQVQDELRLLVLAREGWPGRPVVKSIGGGFREAGAWTEEFVPGKTLDELVEDLHNEPGGESRLVEVWQFLVSTCASLLVDFWRRTDRTVCINSPTAKSLVLPAHDWQIGGRLVSLTGRIRCTRLSHVLESVQQGIVRPLQERFPIVGVEPEWRLLFSSALEAFGVEEALTMLEHELSDDLVKLAVEEMSEEDAKTMAAELVRFSSQVRRHGFLPVRIRIAARRYRRWSQLNPYATLEAQASTLDQIADAYGLDEMETERPGTRLQFYRHTVFRGGESTLGPSLDELTAQILQDRLPREEWSRQVAALREGHTLTDREEFFLARVLYPHLDPKGRAILVREEDLWGGAATGVIVERRDPKGEIYRVRRPANPNEISALYRIFRTEEFRTIAGREASDHLIVTDETDRVIGGLIYRRMSETYVRLEWIVVGHMRRGRGIGAALLVEFLERLRAHGVRAVSTGFFRPAFFAKFGFGVDPRYPGIVKILEPVAESSDHYGESVRAGRDRG